MADEYTEPHAESAALIPASLGLPTERIGALLAGDVNDDDRTDLIVGSLNPPDRPSTFRPGTFSVLFGSRSGLTTEGRQTFRQGVGGVPGPVGPHDRFADAFSLTDTDRNRRSELVVGAPGADGDKGGLYIFPSTAAGLTTKGNKHFGAAALGTGKKAQLGRYLLQ